MAIHSIGLIQTTIKLALYHNHYKHIICIISWPPVVHAVQADLVAHDGEPSLSLSRHAYMYVYLARSVCTWQYMYTIYVHAKM